MNKNRLAVVVKVKDLGVHFDKTLKFSDHCAKAAAKAISVLRVIKRTFSNLTRISSLNYTHALTLGIWQL